MDLSDAIKLYSVVIEALVKQMLIGTSFLHLPILQSISRLPVGSEAAKLGSAGSQPILTMKGRQHPCKPSRAPATRH